MGTTVFGSLPGVSLNVNGASARAPATVGRITAIAIHMRGRFRKSRNNEVMALTPADRLPYTVSRELAIPTSSAMAWPSLDGKITVKPRRSHRPRFHVNPTFDENASL